MNIYLLQRNEERVGWDTVAGYVIIAKNSTDAREIAFNDEYVTYQQKDWLDDNLSTCVKIGRGDGPGRIILCDFRKG